MRRLSELEGAVMALLWRDGPMTGYAVRAVFAASPTGAYGSSTGSIYPLIRRLEREELIASSRRSDDARGARELRMTSVGKRAVRAWLGAVDEAVLALPADPVRLRVLFLDLLEPEKRALWLQRAAAGLASELDAIEEIHTGLRSRADCASIEQMEHATAMALGVARARLESLRAVLGATGAV